MGLASQVTKTLGGIQITGNSEFKVGSTTSVNIASSPAATALGTSATTVTGVQLLAGIITQTPASALTITLPSYAAITAAFPSSDNVQVGDTFRFSVVNLSGSNAITVAAGTNGSLVGGAVVATSSSASFVVQVTNVATPAYVVYRSS